MNDLVTFFINLYQKIGSSNRLINKCRLPSVFRFATRILANFILPLYFKITENQSRYKLNIDDSQENDNNSKIIISFTSFPARINRVWIVVETLLRQSIKPDRIILYLSQEQFPNSTYIPHSLIKLKKRGLEIKIVNGDIKPHKKYYYSILDYVNDYIITVDDDIFYKRDFIKDLLFNHAEHPKSIICNIASTIGIDKNGEIIPYNLWKRANSNTLDNKNFLIGCGGVLYPPHSLNNMVTNMEIFMNICPTTDDIWLNAMAQLNNTSIYVADNKIMLPVLNLHPQNLHSLNVNKNVNDINIETLILYYKKNYNIKLFDLK